MRAMLLKLVGKVPAPPKTPELVKDIKQLSMGEIVFAIKLVQSKDYRN